MGWCEDLWSPAGNCYPLYSNNLVTNIIVSHQDHAHWQHTSWLHQDMTGDVTIRTLEIILMDTCHHTMNMCRCSCQIISLVSLWFPLKDPGTTILWLILPVNHVRWRLRQWGPWRALGEGMGLIFTPVLVRRLLGPL